MCVCVCVCQSQRHRDQDYGDVCRDLRKVITKDSNVMCVAEAVGCVGALAKGLRPAFSAYAKSFVEVSSVNVPVCVRACLYVACIQHRPIRGLTPPEGLSMCASNALFCVSLQPVL